jgi:LysM repeat protein
MGLLNAPAALAGGILDPIAAKIKNPFSTSLGGPRGQDFPEGFRFQEIVDGRPSDADGATVILRGNMMPEIPFQFGGTQKLVKDYYPGNPEPTTQVLGARESDLVVRGTLKAKRFQDDDFYGAPEAYQQQIDLIRIKGNLLRIWLGEWQRYGFLEETIFKMNKLSEIEYELKFSLVGFTIPTNNKFSLKSKTLPLDVNNELIAEADEFQASYTSFPDGMPRSISDVLNEAISDVAEAVNLVTNFVDTVITTAEDVQASANRAIGLVKNAKSKLSSFRRRVGALQHSFSSMSQEARASAQFKSAYNSSSHVMKAMSQTTSLSVLLARLQKQFEAIARTTPLARHRVKDGETLQRISIKFYNTADNWKKIYDHNKLTSTQLTVGTVLEIPRV